MNKADLIDALTNALGSRRDATLAVDSLVNVVIREVAAGGSVGITGFGTFERAERAPRTGRNPRTGESVPIAGTRSPRFRPGTYFKNVVTDPAQLPAEGLAGGRAPAQRGTASVPPAAPKRSRKPAAPKPATALVAAEDVATIESELKDSAKKALKKSQRADGKKSAKKGDKGKHKGGKKGKKK